MNGMANEKHICKTVFLILFLHKGIKIPHFSYAFRHFSSTYHLHESKQALTCQPIGIIVLLKLHRNRCTIVERSVHYSATNRSPECNDLCTVVERMK